MYGKCQGCEALGQLASVGTISPETSRPIVLQLCRACSPKYLHLNRQQRRALGRTVELMSRPGYKPKRVRPRDDARRIRPKKPSPILVPSEPEQPKPKPQEKRSKGGLILP
jgi:hypothetical protein